MMLEFVRQGMRENTPFKECVSQLQNIFGDRLQ
jgi:hypothetical protein